MLESQIYIEKLKELYVTTRFKYIKQEQDGTYRTFNAKTNKNHYYFNDLCIQNHLTQNATYGIFSTSMSSKFICFDVDTHDLNEAKRAVYVLYHVLEEIGIPSSNIFTSLSGSKGYHVEIFFEDFVPLPTLNIFYRLVMTNFNDLQDPQQQFCGRIELRPTFGQGLKLPLGLHQKTQTICWYVNINSGFVPVESYDFLFSIQKVSTERVYTAIEQFEDYSSAVTLLQSNSMLPSVTDFSDNMEGMRKLLEEGLTQQNTRFISLSKLARYHNLKGIPSEECKILLQEWLKKQPKQLYKSTWDTCVMEICRIVDWTYDKNRKIYNNSSEIQIYGSEVTEIMNDLRLRIGAKVILFAMLVHSKRYPSPNGEFYMTYSQIEEISGLSHGAVCRNVSQLIKYGKIKPVSMGNRKSINGKIFGEPNRYTVNMTTTIGKVWTTQLNGLKQYNELFYLAIHNLNQFHKSEPYGLKGY